MNSSISDEERNNIILKLKDTLDRIKVINHLELCVQLPIECSNKETTNSFIEFLLQDIMERLKNTLKKITFFNTDLSGLIEKESEDNKIDTFILQFLS